MDLASSPLIYSYNKLTWLEPAIQSKPGQLKKKKADLDEL